MREKGVIKRHQTRELEELRQKVVELEASAKTSEHINEALRASEERFRRYFEIGLIGMAITSPTKGIIEANDKICEILGYERMELLQKTWAELTHPDDLAADVTNFNRVMAGEIDGYSLDKRLIRKGGQVVYATISVKCLRRADGSVDYFVALLQDITERTRTEEALRKREEDFRALAENSPDVIERFDEEMRHVYVNPLAAKSHGISAEALIGKTNQQIGAPEHYCRFWKERIQKVFRTGQGIEEENEFPTTSGKRIYQSRLVPEKAKDGAVTSVLMVSRDITDRKRAEETLRESEKRYRSLFENMLDGYAYCQIFFDENDQPVDFEFLEVNSAHEKLTGLKNVVGRRISEVIPNIRELHPELFEIYGRTALTGKPQKFEIYLEFLEAWLSISVYSTQRGYFVAVFDNITERKQAEEALKRSESKYRKLHESMMDGFVFFSMDGRIKEFNESYREMVGYAPEELLKLTYRDLTPEKWHASEKIVDQQTLTRGYSEVYEKEYRKKDGTVFPIELRAFLVKDEIGSNIGMWGIVRDITKRKRIEETLRESEERYRTAIEYSNDGMAMVRGDLYVFVNQKFVEMFGYGKSEEILGKPLSMVVHPDDLKRVEEFRKLASSRYECRVIRKDGKRVDVEVSHTKTVYRGETVSLAYFRDITERKRTEEEREKLIHQLQEALANIKTLRGLLPICASCKKIRDDKGYWNQIESFVRDHSEAEFSHSICPACMKKLYPDFDESMK